VEEELHLKGSTAALIPGQELMHSAINHYAGKHPLYVQEQEHIL